MTECKQEGGEGAWSARCLPWMDTREAVSVFCARVRNARVRNAGMRCILLLCSTHPAQQTEKGAWL